MPLIPLSPVCLPPCCLAFHPSLLHLLPSPPPAFLIGAHLKRSGGCCCLQESEFGSFTSRTAAVGLRTIYDCGFLIMFFKQNTAAFVSDGTRPVGASNKKGAGGAGCEGEGRRLHRRAAETQPGLFGNSKAILL